MKTRKGHLFQRRPGGNWAVRVVVDGNVIVRSTGTPIRREAERRRAEIMRTFALGDEATVLKAVAARIQEAETEAAHIDAEQNPPPPLDRVWMRFANSPLRPDSGDRTLEGYETHFKRFVAWLADRHPKVDHLHEVTPAMAADYARHLGTEKVSASTFNQRRNALRMVWRVLADEARLTVNPWDKIAARKLNALATRKRALTPGQYETLLATVEGDPDLHDLFVILAWTGLRLADAVLLKWSAIDFTRRVISVAPIKTARRQGKVVHIPLFPAAAAVLDKRQEGKPLNPAAFVFPDLADVYERDQSTMSRHISEVFERAGIETSEERSDRKRKAVVYGAHSFRHLFVSAATAAGMPAAMIKSITGHGSDGMLEHYIHLGVDLASELALRVNGKALEMPAVAALPPAAIEDKAQNVEDVLARVKAIAEGMTVETLEVDREALLALVNEMEVKA